MNRSEIRRAVEAEARSLSGRELSTGLYVGSVGYKYVSIVSCGERTKTQKISLDKFDKIGKKDRLGDIISIIDIVSEEN